jgi:hypothetical protein
MESVGTGTRYVFTGLHRDEADFEKNKASGWQQGTEIAVDQFVEHVIAMKEARQAGPVWARGHHQT